MNASDTWNDGPQTLELAAATTISEGQRVALDATGLAIVAGADDGGIGVADRDTSNVTGSNYGNTGQKVTVILFNLGGRFGVTASGVIAKGDRITWATAGKVAKAEGTGRGVALTAAADGESVQVIFTGVTEETDVSRLVPAITTQGDTGAASTVTVSTLGRSGGAKTDGPTSIRVRACNNGVLATSTNATIAATGGSGLLETHTSNKDLTISEVLAVAATGTLTISGVVLDGQTATIGGRVYEFDAREAAHVATGAVRVIINATSTHTVRAAGTLTIAEQVSNGDTFTLGSKTFIIVPDGTANTDGEVPLGADEATSKLNIVAAINGTDGINTAHPQVTAAAFSADACVITALVGGVAGNSLASTETFTHVNNVFNAGTLGTTTAGVDCTAADAVTALAAAITGDGSAVVTAVDGAGDTVVCTAKVAGAGGNAIATTETMTNGAFGAATLAGGISAAPGIFRFTVTDGEVETITIRTGPALVGGPPSDHVTALQLAHAAP